jgi:hypothetical protein
LIQSITKISQFIGCDALRAIRCLIGGKNGLSVIWHVDVHLQR